MLQKEILGKTSSAAGKIRHVSAAWVVESISAGRRLPESRFEGVRVAPRGVRRIEGMFGGTTTTKTAAMNRGA
jgi:hypothetical protein